MWRGSDHLAQNPRPVQSAINVVVRTDEMTIPGWHTFWNVFTLKAKLVTVAVIIGVVLVIWGGYKIFHHEPKIDLKTVDRINKANEVDRLKVLHETIEQNQQVIQTADNRTTIAETSVDERNKAIDAKVIEADKKIAQAQADHGNVSSEELECILTGNCS